MSKVLVSPVKRDRSKREERLKKRYKMRRDLPVLTKEEIRRFRMPLHLALFAELEEQNLPSSAAFLKQLIDYQKWLRKSHGPDSRIWARPRLRNCPDILNKLVVGFKAAEKAHYARDIATECDNFLHLGVHFSFGHSDWWWLGEQLLVQSVNISSKYHGDGQRRLATAKYILGKFLYENEDEREQAITALKEARILSKGHSWTAAKYLHCIQKTVFVECCIVLYRALLAEAKDLTNSDAESAIILCSKARRRAYDACDHEGEAKALMLQGNCEIMAGKVNNAAESFYKVLLMQVKAKRVEETCEARICLIQSYLKLGNWKESYAHLQQLLQFAQSHNLPYYIGQSYRYMGEYYLNHGNPDLATPLLIKALNAFHEIGDINNREQTKNFAAVSAGQELMPKFINFILKCQEGMDGWNYIQKLVRWKDTRDIAWSESSVELVAKAGMNFEDALSTTGLSGTTLTTVLSSYEANAESRKKEQEHKEERKSLFSENIVPHIISDTSIEQRREEETKEETMSAIERGSIVSKTNPERKSILSKSPAERKSIVSRTPTERKSIVSRISTDFDSRKSGIRQEVQEKVLQSMGIFGQNDQDICTLNSGSQLLD